MDKPGASLAVSIESMKNQLKANTVLLQVKLFVVLSFKFAPYLCDMIVVFEFKRCCVHVFDFAIKKNIFKDIF